MKYEKQKLGRRTRAKKKKASPYLELSQNEIDDIVYILKEARDDIKELSKAEIARAVLRMSVQMVDDGLLRDDRKPSCLNYTTAILKDWGLIDKGLTTQEVMQERKKLWKGYDGMHDKVGGKKKVCQEGRWTRDALEEIFKEVELHIENDKHEIYDWKDVTKFMYCSATTLQSKYLLKKSEVNEVKNIWFRRFRHLKR